MIYISIESTDDKNKIIVSNFDFDHEDFESNFVYMNAPTDEFAANAKAMRLANILRNGGAQVSLKL